MPVQKEQAAKLLEALEHIRKRPGMYMTDDMPSVVNFLIGFDIACAVFGTKVSLNLNNSDEINTDVLQERGWGKSLTKHPVREMRESGMNDKAIIEEWLTIAIEVVKRRYFSEDTD